MNNTIATEPEVEIITAVELHPLDGVDPDSIADEILDGIFGDDDEPPHEW